MPRQAARTMRSAWARNCCGSTERCTARNTRKRAAMQNLSVGYRDAGRPDEALKLQEEVLPLRRKVSGPEHRETLGAMTNLSVAYTAAGRLSEAVALQEQALAIKRRVLPANDPILSSHSATWRTSVP